MQRIQGKPEGRPGVWIITPDTAAQLIEAVPGNDIHNILGHGATAYIGCDWAKQNAIEWVRSGVRLALIFPPNSVMGHHLVALSDENRWAFDVGPVSEEMMTPVP